ncbi:MAG TPA: DUF4350 domain-containing protein [Candidatus Binatia bacterium]|nr:DUF4350 domain-containing protein [Candidatus Binatia bacterium]
MTPSTKFIPSVVEGLRLDVVILVACAAVLALLAYERGVTEGEHRASVYSTYDTGPNGYRALYEVLSAAGVPVRRFQRALPLLDPSVRTLVITGYEEDPSAKPLGEQDAVWLRDFVTKGGRLVAIDAEFAGPQDVAPGVGTTVRSSVLRQAQDDNAIPLAHNTFTAGITRLRGTIGWIFPFHDPRVPLLANDKGVVAAFYRVGRGQVVAVTAPAIFSNAQLRNADNVRFAYNAVAGDGDVAFDEYVHGYNDAETMWQALPAAVHAAVWISIGLILVALVGANVPFAPPYLANSPDERDSSHYIAALAELMRRSRQRPHDDDVLRQATIEYRRRKEHA